NGVQPTRRPRVRAIRFVRFCFRQLRWLGPGMFGVGLTFWIARSTHYVQYMSGRVVMAAWNGDFELMLQTTALSEVEGRRMGWDSRPAPNAPSNWNIYKRLDWTAPIEWFGHDQSGVSTRMYIPFWLVCGTGVVAAGMGFWCRWVWRWRQVL